jgi:hypothetical protein
VSAMYAEIYIYDARIQTFPLVRRRLRWWTAGRGGR